MEGYLVIIQPDFCQTNCVLLHDVDILGPFVRGTFSEYVAHMRTGCAQKFTTALPDLARDRETLDHRDRCYYFEGEFEILSTPDLHAGIVHAKLFKPSSIDREQASGHRWTPREWHRVRLSTVRPGGRLPNWIGFLLPSFHLSFGCDVPVEDEIPIEAAHLNVLYRCARQLECRIIDNFDQWNNRCLRIARNRVEQGFDPA